MLLKFVFGIDGSDLVSHLNQLENRLMSEITALQEAVAELKGTIAIEAMELAEKIGKLEEAVAQTSLDREAIAAITEEIKASSATISSFVTLEPPSEPEPEPDDEDEEDLE